MENYLVKTKYSDDTFYVYYDKRLDIYISVVDENPYHKDDIVIVRKL